VEETKGIFGVSEKGGGARFRLGENRLITIEKNREFRVTVVLLFSLTGSWEVTGSVLVSALGISPGR